jgi:hypothetical protein
VVQVSIGRTFSHGVVEVTFRLINGVWTPIAEREIPFTG